MTASAGWEGILDGDERILWQGRPESGIVFRPGNIVVFLFGLAFAGFALVWMILASTAGGYMWTFGLIHFSVGIGLAIGPIYWSAYCRRHTWYSLSNKRAFIATDMPLRGRRLSSYPIDENTILDYDNAAPATIYFHEETRRGKNRTYQVPIGFERVSGGDELYRLFRSVQNGDA